MKSKQANAFRGALDSTSIRLEFGDSEDSEKGTRVNLTDGVALTPEAARRLSLSLEAALRGHSSPVAGSAAVAKQDVPAKMSV